MSGGPFSPAKHPERRCLPLALWPAEDWARWTAACSAGSILDDEIGTVSHLRKLSLAKIEKGYGRWLTYLRCHKPDCMADAPEARITRENVVA